MKKKKRCVNAQQFAKMKILQKKKHIERQNVCGIVWSCLWWKFDREKMLLIWINKTYSVNEYGEMNISICAPKGCTKLSCQTHTNIYFSLLAHHLLHSHIGFYFRDIAVQQNHQPINDSVYRKHKHTFRKCLRTILLCKRFCSCLIRSVGHFTG